MTGINECFEHQMEFGRTVLGRHGVDPLNIDHKDLADWTIFFNHCIHTELGEVMGENEANLGWKRHRAPKNNFRPEEAIKELVDCQKYLWNLFDLWGVHTPDQFVEAFMGKSAEVMERWENENSQIPQR